MSSDLGLQNLLPSQKKQTTPMLPITNSIGLQQSSITNSQMTMASIDLGPQKLSAPKQTTPVVPIMNSMGPPQSSFPNSQMTMASFDPGPQKLPAQKKQTTPVVQIMNCMGPQQSSVSNSQMTMEVPTLSNPKLQNSSVPNKRKAQVVSMPKSLGSQQNKRTLQMEPSPKGQAESSETVRAKMRESLAASLALACKKQNKAVENNSQCESTSTLKSENKDATVVESMSTVDVVSSPESGKPIENLSSKDNDFAAKSSNENGSSQEVSVNENTEDAIKTSNLSGQEFELKYALPDENVPFKENFLVKDELLQGNGLCWASDIQIEVPEEKESHCAKRPKTVHEEVHAVGDVQSRQCPQALATRIEAELFKLFGGVNKKYKEKGRSLLFNLKDRSNPELRERVISGEIPPDRLCSMTAEELASKELSRWRIAKAEELAQMVVLPDQADVRRLVKKTHKGEFQVEFENDNGASVEVALEASSLSQFQPKTNDKDAQGPSNDSVASEGTKVEVNPQDQNLQNSLITLPSDGTDLMQGLEVDELKDAEFLPPIVSLDEFMESLDSEPPFENLPIDAGKKSDEKVSCEDGLKPEPSDICSKDLDDTTPIKPDTVDMTNRTDNNSESHDIQNELDTSSPASVPKQDYVWEGLLQLNVSAMVTVGGSFKSGEKTSVQEWPNFLDVKGRVRLDAFEKFLQELPKSRSRAIMIVHFCCKEGSSESGRTNLSEVVESYIVDQRVGFAEPAPGVELYLCPPHERTFEMLGKNLPKDYIETLNAVNDGLIGIVVWRKPYLTSTISPNSSSHKHKKQHSSVRRQHEKNAGTPTPNPSLVPAPTKPGPSSDNEPIDDVPPGFGPPASLDEDDLPEFDFAGGSNLPVSRSSGLQGTGTGPQSLVRQSPRPVEQMRELIHKYGQSETSSTQRGNWPSRGGIEIQPWNDDDDIPEWQPNVPLAPPVPTPPQAKQQQMPLQPPPSHTPLAPQLMHNNQLHQQLNLTPHIVNQQQYLSMQQMPMPSQQLQLQYPSQPLGSLRPHMQIQGQPSLQLPTNMMIQQGQQNVATQWQQGPFWNSPQHGQSVQANGWVQSCNSGGQFPYEIQAHGTGTPTNIGNDQRPDLSRSRGF